MQRPVFRRGRIQIRKFLVLPDPEPDPLVGCMDPDTGTPLSSKNSIKTLISIVSGFLYDFLSLKNI
jgi:hypothetical protein